LETEFKEITLDGVTYLVKRDNLSVFYHHEFAGIEAYELHDGFKTEIKHPTMLKKLKKEYTKCTQP